MDDKTTTTKQYDWVFGNWVNQFIFFAASLLLCYKGFQADSLRIGMWYYLGFASALLGLSTINLLFSGSVRYAISLCVIIINTYVVPFSAYAFGFPMNASAGVGLVYLIACIALSPLPISVAILVAGSSFAVYQKYYYFDLENTPTKDMFIIIGLYIAAAVVGFCWRTLIGKMHEFLTLSIQSSAGVQERENETLKERLDDMQHEQQLLKEEMAMHIIEMNKMAAKK